MGHIEYKDEIEWQDALENYGSKYHWDWGDNPDGLISFMEDLVDKEIREEKKLLLRRIRTIITKNTFPDGMIDMYASELKKEFTLKKLE